MEFKRVKGKERGKGRVNNEYLLCVIGYLNGCVKKGEGGYNWYI